MWKQAAALRNFVLFCGACFGCTELRLFSRVTQHYEDTEAAFTGQAPGPSAFLPPNDLVLGVGRRGGLNFKPWMGSRLASFRTRPAAKRKRPGYVDTCAATRQRETDNNASPTPPTHKHKQCTVKNSKRRRRSFERNCGFAGDVPIVLTLPISLPPILCARLRALVRCR